MTLYSMRLERDEFQERLGGGLPRGALAVIEGSHGTGKSVLCERMAFGALAAGHTVGFISSELTPDQFFAQMKSLDYPCIGHALHGRLRFASTLTTRAAAPPLGLAGFPEVLARFPQEIVFVDTYSHLIRAAVDAGTSTSDLAATVERTIRAVKNANRSGRTIVLTLDPVEAPPRVIHALTSVADVLATANAEVIGLTTARTVLFRRFSRAGGTVGDVMGFRVEPGAGLIIEIRSVS